MPQRKKIWYLVLIGMFCLLSRGINAFAANATIDQFEYIGETDGIVYITGFKDGYLDVSLGDVFPNATEIIITKNAFQGAEIIKLTIPETVSRIEESAFQGCVSLRTVSFEERATKELTFASAVFKGCQSLTTLYLPEGVIKIPNEFCNNCSGLEYVKLPKSCEYIGESAFAYSGLKQITIPAACTKIEHSVFSDCEALTNVEFEEKTDSDVSFSMGNMAFFNCSALRQIALPKGCITIPDSAFLSCDVLTALTIPDECESIASSAFSECAMLSRINSQEAGKITLPKNCKSIGTFAFHNCINIEKVEIPLLCSSIGEYAFWSCKKLDTVILENSDTVIENYGFPRKENATALKLYTAKPGKVIQYATANDIPIETELTSFKIVQEPTQKEYAYNNDGDVEINHEGIQIMAEFPLESGKGSVSLEIEPNDCKFSKVNSTKVGTQTITVTYGDQMAEFNVDVFYNMDKDGVYIKEIDPIKYKNAKIKDSDLQVKLMNNYTGSLLEQDKDYVMEYPESINVGTVSVKFTGKGNYKGEQTVTFTITPRNIGEESINVLVKDETYTGRQVKPVPIVSYGEEILVEDRDYVVTYDSNIEIGQGIVKIEGIGNYIGSREVQFNIVDSSMQSGTSTEQTTTEQTTTQATQEQNKSTEKTTIKIGKKYTVKKLCYKVTGKNTVMFVGVADKKLKKLVIPEYILLNKKTYFVTKINNRACYGNKKLTTIKVTGDVTVIGTEAFAKCSNLKKVTLGGKLKTIGKKAFYQNQKLTLVTLKDNIATIGTAAFAKCSNLQKVIFNQELKTIGKRAFYADKKLTLENTKDEKRTTDIAIDDKVYYVYKIYAVNIKEEAFAKCSGLRYVAFGENLEVIGKKAFYADKNLYKLDFLTGTKLKKIGTKAFAGRGNRKLEAKMEKQVIEKYRKWLMQAKS